MEKILWSAMKGHFKDNAIIRYSQHGFTKGKKHCLSNPVSFYNKITRFVGERKAVDTGFLGFRKVFDAVPHSILLSSCGMSRCKV